MKGSRGPPGTRRSVPARPSPRWPWGRAGEQLVTITPAGGSRPGPETRAGPARSPGGDHASDTRGPGPEPWLTVKVKPESPRLPKQLAGKLETGPRRGRGPSAGVVRCSWASQSSTDSMMIMQSRISGDLVRVVETRCQCQCSSPYCHGHRHVPV